MSKLGICVIGLGMGWTHAKHFSAMDDVDVSVCDLDSEKMNRAQREYPVIGMFSSIEDALASDAVDAVDLALPHHLHCPVAVKAAEAGKHCMTEKPMALNLREADMMLEAADRAGTRLAVAENYQFMPDSTEACRVMEAGLIGTVFMVRVHELWRMGPRPGSWWFQRETAGGGALISLGIHLVRTLRVLAKGRAKQVFALLMNRVSPELFLEGEDTAMLSVKFDKGIVGSVITSWATAHPGPSPRFAIYGTEGSIIAENNQTLVVHSRRIEGVQPAEAELRLNLSGHPHHDGFAVECRAFVEWIKTGTEGSISGHEGRKDLEVVEAAYRSAQSGEAVRLPLSG